ncbi:MAG: SBBP repeat-containing protein [Bacteroidia bacterium]|jgi:hypothetical protein|nr:SBBP repeat-containing protein [Bacteroidia bacterium]
MKLRVFYSFASLILFISLGLPANNSNLAWSIPFCNSNDKAGQMSVNEAMLNENLKEFISPKNTTRATFTQNNKLVWDSKGNYHSEVRYYMDDINFQLFLLETGLAYQFTNIYENEKDCKNLKSGASNINRTETFRIDIELIGANPNPIVSHANAVPENDKFALPYHKDINSYRKVTYHEIYPGIDWVIYTKDEQVKYDFIVKPGADPSLIRIRYNYQNSLIIDSDGSLLIRSQLGDIRENPPVSYQNELTVKTRFILKNDILTYEIGSYDKSKNLVIDPALLWSTYYGGTGYDRAMSCASDVAGNVYLAGFTSSTINIASGGYQNSYNSGTYDAYLVKFNSAGVRLWASYLGGNGDDRAYGCATDIFGNVYISGYTTSTANIAFNGFQNAATGLGNNFLSKFNTNGTLLWSTYYGGYYYGGGIPDPLAKCATDKSGNVYLSGTTFYTVGIASGGHQNTYSLNGDAYLVKFNPNGSRIWATYYGGNSTDLGLGVATDNSRNVYITGSTGSGNNIYAAGFQSIYGGGSYDSFLVKFDSAGVRQWGTYYGGTGTDGAYGCTTDQSGNVYICGVTNSYSNIASGGFQNTNIGNAANSEAFLVKFNSSGARLWGTYYGGTSVEIAHSCATDSLGNIYMTGVAGSGGLAYNGLPPYVGGGGCFLVKFFPDGSRHWGSYFGGPGGGEAYECTTGKYGNVYICGATTSTNQIAYNGHQNTNGTNTDGFLLKICDWIPISAISGNTLHCVGSPASFSIPPVPGAASYSWSLAPGWTSTSTVTNTLSAIPGLTGLIKVSAQNGCPGSGYAQTLSVTVYPTPTIVASSGTICAGSSITLTANGANTYSITGNSFAVSPSSTTSYTIIGTSAMGCQSTIGAVATVTVFPNPTIQVVASNNGTVCSGGTVTFIPTGAQTYTISGGTFTVTPNNTSIYTVTGTSGNGCVSQASSTVAVTVFSLPIIQITSTADTICAGSEVTLTATGASSFSWSNGSQLTTNPVIPLVSTIYTVTGISSDGCFGSALFKQHVILCTNLYSIIDQGALLKVYPNPTEGMIFVESQFGQEVRILSIDGRLLEKQILQPGKNSLNLMTYQAGIYYLLFENGQNKQRIELIKL